MAAQPMYVTDHASEADLTPCITPLLIKNCWITNATNINKPHEQSNYLIDFIYEKLLVLKRVKKHIFIHVFIQFIDMCLCHDNRLESFERKFCCGTHNMENYILKITD